MPIGPVSSATAVSALPDIASRVAAYDAGRDPARDLLATYGRIEEAGLAPVWISLLGRDQVISLLRAAQARRSAGERLALFGIPFSVKDNIDVAGVPTTAGCPAFAYLPDRSAAVVERLVAAGAIPIGKTNLDQFATGLNGTRSPYGIPTCAFDDTLVSGGSSSGSAVAVARGLVPFALGTDTAGSGRVPAAFNNLVGLKPTKGLISTRGVLPACRTQDCVSIFAASAADALLVLGATAGPDPEDPFSRSAPAASGKALDRPRFGVPSRAALETCEPRIRAGHETAARALEALGGVRVEMDLTPFLEAAALLYAGPWVVERLMVVRDLLRASPDAIHPVVREVVEAGQGYDAASVFEGQYRLAELRRQADAIMAELDLLLLPTAPEHPTIAEMLADPIGRNARLGTFTNFVNLLDLAAIAVPAGFDERGVPVGVSLIGPAFSDEHLAHLGDRLHRAVPGATLAGTGVPVAAARAVAPPDPARRARLAVAGAHLSGQPLNWQLTERGGVLEGPARTAPGYSLYALPGTVPPKPGLVCDGGQGGIDVEIWSLPLAGFGAVVADIPAPLGIGSLVLEDGSAVQGFLCESYAVAGATDITASGGWRAYLASRSRAA